MFSFEKSIVIARTPHEVYNYVADPSNIPDWRKDVASVKSDTHYLQPGQKFEETINFGDLLTNIVEVVDAVPDSRLIFKVIGGTTSYLPLREMWFEEEGQHTKMTVRISVHTDGFTRLIQPISTDMFSIKWESYLFQLKRILDAHTQRLAA
jgi:uncharacterized protein YndB with AHSA1/START domain